MNIFSNIFNGLIKESSFLGVDLGSFSIKVAEISKDRKGGHLKLLAIAETKIIHNEQAKITDDEKIKILSALIKKANINSKKVIFSIENSFTHYAIITLPILKNNKILDYIKLNFNDVLPVNFEDVHLEWRILERGRGNMKVLLIAVNNDIIKRYKEIARIAKVDFYGYEIEATALANALICETDKSEIVALLDIRMKNSSLSLIKNMELIKSTGFGLSVNYFDVNFKIAEEEKKREDKVSREQGTESLDSYFDLFYKKFWLSIVGLKKEEKQQLKKIIISGGADFIPGLARYLQKKINKKLPTVKVEIANPFTNINIDQLSTKPKKSRQFSNAIGAALKGFKK